MGALFLGFMLAAPAVAQEPPVEEVVEEPVLEGDTGDTGDAGDTAVEADETRPKARKQKRRRPAEQARDLTPYYIAVAALLGLWLVTRLQPKRRQVVRHERHEPLSDDELGRLVFRAVVAADLDQYVHLFLTGGEASRVLHGGAEAYMARRSTKAFEDALVELSVHIPEGALFSGTSRVDDVLHIEVRNDRGATRAVPVGTTTKVGAILRLVTPAGAPR